MTIKIMLTPHKDKFPKTQTERVREQNVNTCIACCGMSIIQWITRHLYKRHPFQTPAKKMIPALKIHLPVNHLFATKTDEIIEQNIIKIAVTEVVTAEE